VAELSGGGLKMLLTESLSCAAQKFLYEQMAERIVVRRRGSDIKGGFPPHETADCSTFVELQSVSESQNLQRAPKTCR